MAKLGEALLELRNLPILMSYFCACDPAPVAPDQAGVHSPRHIAGTR
jgi:hypothetical protein